MPEKCWDTCKIIQIANVASERKIVAKLVSRTWLNLNYIYTRLGCFYVTATLSWGWVEFEIDLRLIWARDWIEVEVEMSVSWNLVEFELRLSWDEVELKFSWSWVEVELSWVEVDLRVKLDFHRVKVMVKKF